MSFTGPLSTLTKAKTSPFTFPSNTEENKQASWQPVAQLPRGVHRAHKRSLFCAFGFGVKNAICFFEGLLGVFQGQSHTRANDTATCSLSLPESL